MEDRFLKRLTLADGENRKRSFDYYITVQRRPEKISFSEEYGVRIEEVGGAQASVQRITGSEERICELAGLLIKGGVTPTSLADVVSDWL